MLTNAICILRFKDNKYVVKQKMLVFVLLKNVYIAPYLFEWETIRSSKFKITLLQLYAQMINSL